MKNFQRLGTFDPMPLLHQIQLHQELWGAVKVRTAYKGTAHADAEDILIRFNSEDALKMENPLDHLETLWYPTVEILPYAKAVALQQMSRVGGTRLGRVMLTRLQPGGRIQRHKDEGAYPAYYERYHYCLQGGQGNVFSCGGETVEMQSGEVWWFQNLVEHSVANAMQQERIHLIVDIHL